MSTARVLAEVTRERRAQDEKWGESNHPDGTGGADRRAMAAAHLDLCASAFAAGSGTWRHILAEEFTEALAQDNPARLRVELVQVAAVAVAWIEAIDRRSAAAGR